MWHEARRSERKVHDMMDAARKRAQRRAVYLAKRRGDPQQSIQLIGNRCKTHRDNGLYQATEDQQGLIPWNGKQDILIDRFDGRALLDFIRDPSSRRFRAQEKTEEEEELEEFVNFERYRDLIKHRRRGCRYFFRFESLNLLNRCIFSLLLSKCFLSSVSDEDGLRHVNQVMEEKASLPFLNRSNQLQPPASRGSYSQVGFSYDGDSKDDAISDDEEDEDDDEEGDEEEFNSDDSNDENMEVIAKEFGVKRYGWLVYMDKKAKEEERRQKELIKGDPSIRKLSRKERRKASQMERERERDASRFTGTRILHHDPYRECRRSPTYEAYPRSRRSRSRSHSPSYCRRHSRGHSDDGHRSKSKAPKIEFITEFGGSPDRDHLKLETLSPPSSPYVSHVADVSSRPSSGLILEALHVDPASGVSLEKDKNVKVVKPLASTSTGLAKLNKTTPAGLAKQQQGEKKETPQERLKRIMSKQLNKQSMCFGLLIFVIKLPRMRSSIFLSKVCILWLARDLTIIEAVKKDTAAEMAKKREQERRRLEKLAESSRASRYRHRSRSRSLSRSPPRRRRHSRSPSRGRSSRRHHSGSGSHSRSPSHSRSQSPSWSHSGSPRRRSRSRY
ncbi:CLK4-associating serine/arginine rich protein-like protein [Drosera capensis]